MTERKSNVLIQEKIEFSHSHQWLRIFMIPPPIKSHHWKQNILLNINRLKKSVNAVSLVKFYVLYDSETITTFARLVFPGHKASILNILWNKKNKIMHIIYPIVKLTLRKQTMKVNQSKNIVHVIVVLSMSELTKQLKTPSHVPCHSWPISPM